MAMRVLGVGGDIWNLDDRTIEDRPPCYTEWTREHRVELSDGLNSLGWVIMVRDKVDQFSVELIDGTRLTVAQLHCALRDHVEHRPDIGRRAANDA